MVVVENMLSHHTKKYLRYFRVCVTFRNPESLFCNLQCSSCDYLFFTFFFWCKHTFYTFVHFCCLCLGLTTVFMSIKRDFYQSLRASDCTVCVCVCVMAISGQDLTPPQISLWGRRATFLRDLSAAFIFLFILLAAFPFISSQRLLHGFYFFLNAQWNILLPLFLASVDEQSWSCKQIRWYLDRTAKLGRVYSKNMNQWKTDFCLKEMRQERKQMCFHLWGVELGLQRSIICMID